MERYRKFKGTASEYTLLHREMKMQIPKPEKCKLCNEVNDLDLANVSQKYLNIQDDWMYLCQSCHRKFDSPRYRFNGEWIRQCTICKEWKTAKENFYLRKGTSKKNGKIYQRVDYTTWCKACTYTKLNPRLVNPYNTLSHANT